jgi:hypothetical protein
MRRFSRLTNGFSKKLENLKSTIFGDPVSPSSIAPLHSVIECYAPVISHPDRLADRISSADFQK